MWTNTNIIYSGHDDPESFTLADQLELNAIDKQLTKILLSGEKHC